MDSIFSEKELVVLSILICLLFLIGLALLTLRAIRYEKIINKCYKVIIQRNGKKPPEICMRHYKAVHKRELCNMAYFSDHTKMLLQQLEIGTTYRMRTHQIIINKINREKKKLDKENSDRMITITSPVPYKERSVEAFKLTVQGHRFGGRLKEYWAYFPLCKKRTMFYELTIRIDMRK